MLEGFKTETLKLKTVCKTRKDLVAVRVKFTYISATATTVNLTVKYDRKDGYNATAFPRKQQDGFPASSLVLKISKRFAIKL